MTTTDQTRQQAQDLLVHVEELLADVSDPATARDVRRHIRATASRGIGGVLWNLSVTLEQA